MDRLDRHLLEGESVILDRDFYNELVDKLAVIKAPGPFQITASSSTVVVDYVDGYPMSPGTVIFSDVTNWANASTLSHIIVWTLSGVGHLNDGSPANAVRRTALNGAVTWSWSSETELDLEGYVNRDWSAVIAGRELPTHVSVAAQAYKLTNVVSSAPVATLAALSATNLPNGARVYVLEQNKIYTRNAGAGAGAAPATGGGFWQEAEAPVLVSVGSNTKSVRIDRAYDPNYNPLNTPRLHPRQEAVFLDGGGGEVMFDDLTAFRSDTVSATRAIAVKYKANNSSTGLTVLGSSNGTDIFTLSAEDRSFSVISEYPGTVIVTATYVVTDDDSQARTLTSSKEFTVWGAGHTNHGISGTPSLPANVSVLGGNGYTDFVVGSHATISNIQDLSVGVTTPGPTIPRPEIALDYVRIAGKVNKVQSIAGTEGFPVAQLAAANEIMSQAIADELGSNVRIYSATISPGINLTNLKNQSIFGDGLSGRITSVNATTRVIQFRGHVSAGITTSIVHITGAADQITVIAEFGYGQLGADSFPRNSFYSNLIFDPDSRSSKQTVVLPQMSPIEEGDAWYVKYSVYSSWDGEQGLSRDFDWVRAETRVGGHFTVNLVRYQEDTYNVEITKASGLDLYGSYKWVDSRLDEGDARAAAPATFTMLLPDRFQVTVPAQMYEGASLEIDGYYRTKGGSSQNGTLLVRSNTVVPQGITVISSNGLEEVPPIPAPVGVVFFKNLSGKFCSIAGEWVRLGGTAVSRVSNITIAEGISGVPVDAIQTGHNAFQHALSTDFDFKNLVVRVFIEGSVRSARLLSGPRSASSFSNGTLTLTAPNVPTLPTGDPQPQIYSDTRAVQPVTNYIIEVTPTVGPIYQAVLSVAKSPTSTDVLAPAPITLQAERFGVHARSLDIDISSPIWKVFADPNKAGAITVSIGLQDKSGVVQAYPDFTEVDRPIELDDWRFDPATQTLIFEFTGFTESMLIQFRAVDAANNTNEDPLVLQLLPRVDPSVD